MEAIARYDEYQSKSKISKLFHKFLTMKLIRNNTFKQKYIHLNIMDFDKEKFKTS